MEIYIYNGEKMKKIIQKAQNGDKQAQEELYKLYFEKIYRLAYTITKNPDNSMDIVQDTFISAFNNLKKLRNIDAFEPWLCQITRNYARQNLNKNKRFVDIQNSDEENEHDIFDNIPDNDEAIMPESVIDNQVKRELILQTINELSEEQRECVFLFYYNGLSVKEIAKIQECSEGTIKSRLNYARQKIHDRILEIEKDNDIRLHSLLPIGILLSQISIPDSAQIEQMWKVIKGSAGIAGAIGVTASTASGEATKGGIFATIKAKIIAGITAASVVTGGIVIANLPKPIEFSDPAMETNIRVLIDKPTGNIYADDIDDISGIVILDDGVALPESDDTALSGSVPVNSLIDLQKLENLKELDLSVQTPQPLLDTLGKLDNLYSLTINKKDMNSVSDFSFLDNLKNVEDFYCSIESGVDLTALENKDLKYLWIAIDGEVTLDVSNITSLKYLGVACQSLPDGNNFINILASKPLNDLIMLEIDTNYTKSLDFLNNMPSLEYLAINSREQGMDLTNIGKLQNLRYCLLGLVQCDMSPLLNCPNLELWYSHNPINPVPNMATSYDDIFYIGQDLKNQIRNS